MWGNPLTLEITYNGCSPPHTGNLSITHNNRIPKLTLVVEVLSVDTIGQLNIFGHDHNAFCVDDTQVGIFQEASQVIPCCFLQCHDCTHLEVQVISPKFLGYLMHELCEGALANEELSAILVLADLVDSYNPWPVLPGPLHETFPRKLFLGGFSSHSGPDTTG